MIVERDVQAYLEQVKDQQRVTPVAKRMAEFTGVRLSDLAPARPGAVITKADVTASLQYREQPASQDTQEPVSSGLEAASQKVPLTPTAYNRPKVGHSHMQLHRSPI
jgi:hypothetical protein